MHVWVDHTALAKYLTISFLPLRKQNIQIKRTHSTMPVGKKRTKQNDYVATALAVHRAARQKKAKQPEDAAAAVIVVPLTPSRKTKVVTVASEPRRSARLMAKQQLNENNGQELQNNDNMAAIGNIVAVENAAIAAPDAAPVLLPPPPIHQRGVHWPEAIVSDVLVYDNERPTPSFSSCGKWFMNCFFLIVLVALVFAGAVPSHDAVESTAVAIRTVIPSVAFLPHGGIEDEQSIGGDPDDEGWSSSANRTLALVPRHNAAASSVVAIPTVISSELPSFFFPCGSGMEEQSVGGDPYVEWRSVVVLPNETAWWSLVAHRAVPSDRKKKRQQLIKTKQHIVRNATRDDWINIIIEQVHGTAIWEWVDVVAPPATCL
jgi:hypothetical protein